MKERVLVSVGIILVALLVVLLVVNRASFDPAASPIPEPPVAMTYKGDQPATERRDVPSTVTMSRVVVGDHRRGQLVVFVHESSGLPIEGASIDRLTEQGGQVLGSTGRDGYASIPVEQVTAVEELMVSAPSYATEFISMSEIDGDEIHVLLVSSGAISGFIQDVDSQPVGPGLQVTAVPLRYIRDGATTVQQELRCIYGLSTLTDHAGRFVLGGVSEGVAYRLEVVSEQYAVRGSDRLAKVVANADGITITVHEVYGVILKFECQDQSYLAEHFGTPMLTTTSLGVAGTFEGLPFWERGVGLKRGVMRGLDIDSYSIPLLFAKISRGGYGVRTIKYGATIPGFATVHEQFEVHPLRLGPLPFHVIDLVPNAEGFGRVEVLLVGEHAELLMEKGASAQLRLSHGATRQRFSYPMSWKPGGVHAAVIPNVPAGRYGWTLSFDSGWMAFEGGGGASPVELEAGGVARIEVPVSGIAYLELECHDANGPVVADLLIAKGPYFTSGHASRLRSMTCLDSPYLFGPLSPGYYEVRAEEFPSELPDGVRKFELEPGMVHVEVFVFP